MSPNPRSYLYVPEAHGHAVVLASLMSLGGKLTEEHHGQVDPVQRMVRRIFNRRNKTERKKFEILFPRAFGINPKGVSLAAVMAALQ